MKILSLRTIRTLLVTSAVTMVIGGVALTAVPIPSHAISLKDILTGSKSEFKKTTGSQGTEQLQNELDPVILMVNIINYALTFLAILVVSLILYAGFLYMTASGDKDKVKKAQDILKYSLIGLVVILSAWGITLWVFDTIQEKVIMETTVYTGSTIISYL